jgi:hypothetical protein
MHLVLLERNPLAFGNSCATPLTQNNYTLPTQPGLD